VESLESAVGHGDVGPRERTRDFTLAARVARSDAACATQHGLIVIPAKAGMTDGLAETRLIER